MSFSDIKKIFLIKLKIIISTKHNCLRWNCVQDQFIHSVEKLKLLTSLLLERLSKQDGITMKGAKEQRHNSLNHLSKNFGREWSGIRRNAEESCENMQTDILKSEQLHK